MMLMEGSVDILPGYKVLCRTSVEYLHPMCWNTSLLSVPAIAAFLLSGHPDSKEMDVAASTSCVWLLNLSSIDVINE